MTEIRTFDNTRLQAFLDCPRKYYYRHVMHLDSTSTPTPLVFGIAIHASLEYYYENERDSEGAIREFERVLVEEGFEPDYTRTLEKGKKILENYFEGVKDGEPWKTMEVELGFEIALGVDSNSNPLHFTGRIDRVLDWGNYGVLPDDFKTFSVKPPLIHPNRQFTGYVVACKVYYDNVYGASMTGLKVPRNMKDFAVEGKRTTRSNAELELWKEETLQIIRNIDSCGVSGCWPQNAPNACQQWNRLCVYHSLCEQRCELEDLWVSEDEFVVSPWEPVKGDG